MKALGEDADQTELMQWMSTMRPILVWADENGEENDCVQNLVDAALWPHSLFCKEAFVAADEMEYKGFPSDFQDELCEVAELWATSKPCETAHSKIQD